MERPSCIFTLRALVDFLRKPIAAHPAAEPPYSMIFETTPAPVTSAVSADVLVSEITR